MCLILLAWRVSPRFPLMVAANRDEFHARPAARARFWTDQPSILAGRDLQAQGTWMGVARNGRFAAVTNFRGGTEAAAACSRGALVPQFLASSESASTYVADAQTRQAKFSGFNLLVFDGKELWWMSNRNGRPRQVEPGLHGLGNLLLDSPEVDADKRRFGNAVATAPSLEPLLEVLGAAKLVDPRYGTRCSTVYVRGADGSTAFSERAFDAGGSEQETLRFEFPQEP